VRNKKYDEVSVWKTPREDLFGGAVNPINAFSCFYFLIPFFTPLHVSAIFRWNIQSLMEAIMPTTDPFLGYIIYIYIYIYISFSFLLCYTLFLYLRFKLLIMY
jgi:hypothetical protein